MDDIYFFGDTNKKLTDALLEERHKDAKIAELQAEVKALQEEISFLEAGHLQAENARLRDVIRTVLEHWEKDPVMRAHTQLGRLMISTLKAGDE